MNGTLLLVKTKDMKKYGKFNNRLGVKPTIVFVSDRYLEAIAILPKIILNVSKYQNMCQKIV